MWLVLHPGLMERPGLMPRGSFGRRALLASAVCAAIEGAMRSARADPAVIRVGYLRWLEMRQTISLLDKAAPDNGLAGAKLAMNGNDTTGRFMNQAFELVDTPVHTDDAPAALLDQLAEQGTKLIVSDLPADRLLKMADAGRSNHLVLFNIAAPDDALRQEDCRNNVIHVAPSRAML